MLPRSSLFSAFAALLLASPALADTIPVPNGSFESPDQAYEAPYASPGLDSWQQSPTPDWWLAMGYTAADWYDTAGAFLNVPFNWIDNIDGRQAAFMFAAPNLEESQLLNNVYQVGQSYQLTVGIEGGGYGMKLGVPMAIGLYYIDANKNQVMVSTFSFTNDNTLTPGGYISHLPDRVLTIPAVSASDAWAGKNIGVALLQLTTTAATSSVGGYWDIDNVRLVSTSAPAFNAVWTGAGAGNTNWSYSGNWSGTVPASGTSLTFGDPGTGQTANMNDMPAGISFPGITFAAGAPAYNLQGNAIQISGPVVNQSNSNQTISLDMDVTYGGGTFDTGGGSMTVAGAISGSSLTKLGDGSLILSGSNSFTDGTTVLDGTLVITTPDGLPSGSSLTVGVDAQLMIPPASSAPVESTGSSTDDGIVSPVPEPETLALLAAGMAVAGVGLRGRLKTLSQRATVRIFASGKFGG